MNVAPVTDTGIEVERPWSSLTVIVALPPPTGVTVNVALVLVSSRRSALVELPAATVTTLVFEEMALNVPEYPGSLTVNVCGVADENEKETTDGVIEFVGTNVAPRPADPQPASTAHRTKSGAMAK